MPTKQSIFRQRLAVVLRRINHHLYDAFNIPVCGNCTGDVHPQPSGDGRTHLLRVEVFAFDLAGFHNVEREGFKLGFLPELKSQPLHTAEQSSLPVPYIRQRRSDKFAGDVTLWQIVGMERDQIIAKLREYAPELKAAGVEHLFLHGSYARGTAIRGSSDVDIIAEFEPGRRLSLVDMVAIQNRLTELLGVRVDLSPAKTLRKPVRDKAEREAVLAF